MIGPKSICRSEKDIAERARIAYNGTEKREKEVRNMSEHSNRVYLLMNMDEAVLDFTCVRNEFDDGYFTFATTRFVKA